MHSLEFTVCTSPINNFSKKILIVNNIVNYRNIVLVLLFYETKSVYVLTNYNSGFLKTTKIEY